MKYNAIIFTDISDYFIPIRTHGAYSIAAHLRDHGYTVMIKDNKQYIYDTYKENMLYGEEH